MALAYHWNIAFLLNSLRKELSMLAMILNPNRPDGVFLLSRYANTASQSDGESENGYCLSIGNSNARGAELARAYLAGIQRYVCCK